jgi:hypothetical protein
MNWVIKGSIFTGSVVTVGAGKTYATITAALSAVPTGDILVLYYGGSESETVHTSPTRAIYVKGMVVGASVGQINVGGYSPVNIFGIEGLTFNYATEALNNGNGFLNRCIATSGIAFWNTANGDTSDIEISNCTATGSTLVTLGSANYTAPHTKVIKCLCAPQNPPSPHPAIFGIIESADYVTTATPGYGAGYGTDFIYDIVSIEVLPVAPSILNGQTQQFQAIATLQDSSAVDITSLVAWSSSHTNIATIDSAGLATSVLSGITTITATFGSVSGSTSLTIGKGTLKWGNGTPIVIPFSGVYTLTDEHGNTIKATVDYDALPDQNESDDIYVFIGKSFRTIERMKPRFVSDIKDGFFVDCGLTYDGRVDSVPQYASVFSGLDHLEGQTVAVIADGVDIGRFVVVNGTVTIPTPALVVHIGLPIIADFETLNLASARSDISDKKKMINAVEIIVDKSKGFKIGPDVDHLDDYKLNSVESYDSDNLVSGNIDVGINSTWNKIGRLFIRQAKAEPVNILAVIPQVEIGGF